MNAEERRQLELEAYHDGELSWWRRWRVERRLARDPAARRDVNALGEVGQLVREVADEAAAVGDRDLWSGIEAQLAVTPAPVAAGGRRERVDGGLAGPLRWGGAIAAAGAALALTLFIGNGAETTLDRTTSLHGSVEWLDSGGEATMVLQDDEEATIIWVVSEAKIPGTTPEVSQDNWRMDQGMEVGRV